MTDVPATSSSAPPPGGSADGANNAAPTPSTAPSAAADAAPPAATRPDWLPESYWDPKANALNTDEFGRHYTETAAKAAKLDERLAAVPEKPDGYKVEVKLPDGVKVPDGVTFDPAKDPRTPQFLQVAHALGLDQKQVNDLIAFDAQLAIAGHTAEQARVAEETKKLGEKASERIAAVTNWAKGLKDKGDLTADEFNEIRMTAATAAGVTALEKLIAKAAGSVPGTPDHRDPPAQPKTLAERMYPHLPSGLPPASSARSA